MLLTSVRVRPWSCLWVLVSLGRVTTMSSPSRLTPISGWRSRSRLPLGPDTVMWRPSMSTSTPAGTGIGSRPIRDIGLPDVRQDFTAELGLAGLGAGHDPLAGADDDDAESAQNSRDVGLAGVHPEPGLADPLETADDRHLAVDVAQGQPQDVLRAVLLLGNLGDEAFGLEDAGDLALGPGSRDDDLGVAGPRRVPGGGQHGGE